MAEHRPREPVGGRLGASAAAPEFDLAAWVRRSTATQGLPEKLADVDVILAVARLLMPVLNPRLSQRPRLRTSGAAGRAPTQEEAVRVG